MALMKCVECKKEISDEAEMCPHCGYRYKESNNKSTKKASDSTTRNVVIGVVVGILLLLFVLLMKLGPSSSQEKMKESLQVDIDATISGKHSNYYNGNYYNKISWYGTIYPKEENLTCYNVTVSLLLKANYTDWSYPHDTVYYEEEVEVELDSSCEGDIRSTSTLYDWADSTSVTTDYEIKEITGNITRFW